MDSTSTPLTSSSTAVTTNMEYPEHTYETNSGAQISISDDSNNNNSNNNDTENPNYNVDDQGRKWMIVGDVNHKGEFLKKVTGNFWTPLGIPAAESDRRWYHTNGCFFAPSAPSHFIVTGIAITALVVLFCVFVVPSDEIWSRVIISILWLINLVMIYLGTSTEPGIVLPARHGDVFYPEGEKNVFISEEVGRVNLRPCNVCKITKPYRASHCTESQVCIKEYDHYCGVFGNVIGRRTMRYFLGSIWSSMATFLFMMIRSAVILKELHDIGLDKVKSEPGGTRRMILIWVYLIMGSCFFLCGGCFSGVHVHNAFLGRNERDAMRTKHDSQHKEYGSHGKYQCTCENFWNELCGDKGESELYRLTSEEDLKCV